MKYIWIIWALLAQVTYAADSFNIDPLCVTSLMHATEQVDLRHCGIKSNPNQEKSGVNAKLVKLGFVGYDFKQKLANNEQLQGYAYYKSLGKVLNSELIETIYHGGGTGEVTALSLLKKAGNKLTVTTLNTGDRCNHGLLDVKRVRNLQGDELYFSVKLTSYDILTLSGQNIHNLKPFKDLGDCAVCCKATALYKRDLIQKVGKEQLVEINLAAFQEAPIDNSSQTYQTCFDKLLASELKIRQKLSYTQLVHFMEKFNRTCGNEK